jgi:hypothetical protein
MPPVPFSPDTATIDVLDAPAPAVRAPARPRWPRKPRHTVLTMFAIEHQVFMLIGREPYKTRFRDTTLYVYRSECVDCGAPFIVKMIMSRPAGAVHRRCSPCRKAWYTRDVADPTSEETSNTYYEFDDLDLPALSPALAGRLRKVSGSGRQNPEADAKPEPVTVPAGRFED